MLLAVLSITYFANGQWTINGNDIYNTNTGNVGIGTSTPGVKLDVLGAVRSTNFILSENFDNVLNSVDNGNVYPLIGTYRGWDAKGVYIAGYNAGNSAAANYTTATERVYIGNPTFNSNYLSVNLLNGNVGIGTTSTGTFKLAVEGKIGAREVRVTNANPWPDYVFAKEYKLKSLASLEEYISKNNRLPNMPSAEEVKNNGIELGNMNARVVEKIEELTLYIIDMNKKMEKLEKDNAELRNQLKK